MKFKTTSKAIKQGYGSKYLWRVGYCDLQNLLSRLEPKAYTCGVYGWNYDLYDIEGVGITTGYRGMVGERVPSELIRKYETLANEIITKPFTYEQKSEDLENLRKEFIKELYERKA